MEDVWSSIFSNKSSAAAEPASACAVRLAPSLPGVGFYTIKELEGFSLAGIKQWYIMFARP
jgi:hypothetical protein